MLFRSLPASDARWPHEFVIWDAAASAAWSVSTAPLSATPSGDWSCRIASLTEATPAAPATLAVQLVAEPSGDVGGEMVLKAGDMERCLKSLVWHLEEPRVGQSYPNYYAAKLASRFGKVVLSGAGGDELFAGYPWRYYRAATARATTRRAPGNSRRKICAPSERTA